MHASARIIIPYFGTLPPWFPLFLASCETNRGFNWLLITDDPPSYPVPDNVVVREQAFGDYMAVVSETLGVDASGWAPYKLCDLKPFYGLLHAEELRGFDFWGFGDVDLIYGDLGKFFPPSVFERYDAIFTCHDRLSGHFSLLRNTPKFVNLAGKIPGWRDILAREEHSGMDEREFGNLFFRIFRHLGRPKGMRWYALLETLGLRALLDRRVLSRELYTTPLTPVPWHDGTRFWQQPLEWTWEKGRMTADSDGFEVPYMHFMNFKSSMWLKNGMHKAMKRGYVPAPPAGCTADQAPWERLESFVTLPMDGETIRHIHIAPDGLWADTQDVSRPAQGAQQQSQALAGTQLRTHTQSS